MLLIVVTCGKCDQIQTNLMWNKDTGIFEGYVANINTFDFTVFYWGYSQRYT